MSLYYDLTPTGIPGLDEVLGGGLIKGRTYLISGETGTGKTLLSLSFLINGIFRYGEPGIYVSVDETYDQLMNGVRRFGWDLETLREQGYLEVLIPEMDIIEKIREKDPMTIAKSLVYTIADYAKSLEAQRLVIDPIAPLVTLEKDVQILREYIRALVMGIEREVGVTTIITTEIPTGGARVISRYGGVEEFLAAGVFITGLAQTTEGDFKRYLFIRKMRWQAVQPTILEVEIQPKTGIMIKGPLKDVHIPFYALML
ncbi:ATPase domain-containing protein [Vulcanisaeta souniana]|uniref:ATPase domain-containing protein n=1 Tax=Vulcanisaeta souniana TaxID=164452 RepID=UPI0006CF89B8|nr:ATPase domain-containing protein [Vulcanisaeta souniana]